jgi:hypothetical protein
MTLQQVEREIFQYPIVTIVPQSRESFLAGLSPYRARPDQGQSLTDCISMHTMRLHGFDRRSD